MRKVLLLFLITLTTLTCVNIVSADTGPKSFIELEFSNVGGDYYITLLSKTDSTGPWSYEYQDEMTDDHYLISDDPVNGAKSWQAFRDYKDSDRFYFIEYFSKSQNNDRNNILIVCPNCHAIIHRNNPNFNKATNTFEFKNGIQLTLKHNKHL